MHYIGLQPASHTVAACTTHGCSSHHPRLQVSGMEELCISGEPLVLVASTSASSPHKGTAKHNAAVYARNLDAVGN